MTGFILNGLSESLLSSRLFRIKAWVLQVPFLSMIFLYFFDYSNSSFKSVLFVFCPYYILIMSYFYAGYYLFRIFTCSFSGQACINLLVYFMLPCLFFIQACVFFIYLVSFFTQNLFQKRHNPCFLVLPLSVLLFCDCSNCTFLRFFSGHGPVMVLF